MRIFDRSRVEAYCGPTTLYHIIAGILPWVLFLGTVIAMVAAWGRIPEQIPMQTDLAFMPRTLRPASMLLSQATCQEC